MITIGGSLNLTHHPVAAIREIADEVGAVVLFDAAHLGGVIAGGAWPNPLDEGAHLMSMSTYKSLGGPPGGLLLGNDAGLAERIEAIAYPGLTANFDAGKTAALAQTMLDWTVAGRATPAPWSTPPQRWPRPSWPPASRSSAATPWPTRSHQFAVEAAAYGGGQTAAARLRRANLLACGIGLPIDPVEGDLNGAAHRHARAGAPRHDGRRHAHPGRTSSRAPSPASPSRSPPRSPPGAAASATSTSRPTGPTDGRVAPVASP